MLKTSRAADPNPAFDLDWNNNVYVWDWDFWGVHKTCPCSAFDTISGTLFWDDITTFWAEN